jgi:hypothetical protein
MDAELNLNQILSQVKKLNKLDQIALVKRLTSMLQEDKSNRPAKISELSGLGSAIWHNVNIDEYVDGERQW